MDWLQLYLFGGLAILSLMMALWLVSVTLQDASIVDIFWGPGFGVAALTYFTLSEGWEGRKLLMLALTLIWGLRLGLHLYRRNHGKGEDYRYRQFRQHYGPQRYWWVSFFQVFLLQGALMWVISAPLLAAQFSRAPNTLTLLDALGTLVWLIGFGFETIGDWQLAQFKANPANRGRVLNTGLWRYTRHPNYFGDACVWWGLWLIACSVPWGWLTAFAPALMTFLLVRVSGVALLEKNLGQRPGYREYVESTSAFVPWPPKQKKKGSG
jgi:steroid 5-alpha reductase family enzyme